MSHWIKEIGRGAFVLLVGLVRLVLSGIGWTLRATWRYYRPRPRRAMVDFVFVAFLVAVLAAGARIYDRSLDAQIEAEVVAEIDRNASFKRNYSRSRASDDPREILKVGGPEWIRHAGIRAIIVESKAAGLDNMETATNLAIADRESGFSPLAKAKKTTACGVYQFVKATGETFGLTTAECLNPRPNARAQVRHFRKIQKKIESQLEELEEEERLIMMFKLTYCHHHDGLSSSACSDTASATVTNGLDLLFAAYEVLEEADRRRQGDVGFAGEVAMVLQESFVATRDFIMPIVARAEGLISSLRGHNTHKVESFEPGQADSPPDN